jgi:hypothetical protein
MDCLYSNVPENLEDRLVALMGRLDEIITANADYLRVRATAALLGGNVDEMFAVESVMARELA